MVYSSPKAVQNWITILEGNIFCRDPNLGLTEEQIYICDGYIQTFMEPAFKAIGENVAGSADQICHDWFGCQNYII